jgi:predicted PurR-regulated permease PerM
MAAGQPTPSTRPGPRWDSATKLVVVIILLILAAAALYFFRDALAILIIGGIVAYVLQPVVRWLRQITRLPHEVATGIIYLLLFGILVTTGIIITPLLADQLKELRDTTIPQIIRDVNARSGETINILGFPVVIDDAVAEISKGVADAVRSAAGLSVALLSDAAKMFLLTIFTVLIGFYMTADAAKIVDWLHRLAPPGYESDLRHMLRQVDQVWSAFFRGQVVLVVVVTIILTVMSAALGLPEPILFGVAGGILEVFLSVGHTIWIVAAIAVAYIEGSTLWQIPNWAFALIVAGAHLVFTKFDLSYLIPKITGERVKLHPMVVILGIIIGASVGGVLGIILAAPTIATLRIVGRYVYAMLLDIEPFPPEEPTRPEEPLTTPAKAAKPATRSTKRQRRATAASD